MASRHCAAARLRSGSPTRLRSAAQAAQPSPSSTSGDTKHTDKSISGLDLAPPYPTGLLIFKKRDTRSAASPPEIMESPTETPPR